MVCNGLIAITITRSRKSHKKQTLISHFPHHGIKMRGIIIWLSTAQISLSIELID